jgi:hypothetical protein
VPPPYPRDRPALEVALPGDTTTGFDHGWRDGERRTRDFLFGDGQWHPVTVRAWWTDDLNRTVVQIEFWDESAMTTREGTYLFDPEKAREG